MKNIVSFFRDTFGDPVARKSAHASSARASAWTGGGSSEPRELADAQEVASNIEDLKRFLTDEAPEDPLYATAFSNVLAKSESVEDLVWLYGAVGERSPFARGVLAKLDAKTDDALDELTSAYSDQDSITPLSRLLLKKALARAKTPADFVSIGGEVQNSDDEDQKALVSSLEKIEWKKDEWEDLREEAEGTSDALTDLAIAKLAGFCQTPVEALKYYLELIEEWDLDDSVSGVVVARLFELATRQELQLIAELADTISDGDALKDAIDEHLKK